MFRIVAAFAKTLSFPSGDDELKAPLVGITGANLYPNKSLHLDYQPLDECSHFEFADTIMVGRRKNKWTIDLI